jgi:hypothetical protein
MHIIRRKQSFHAAFLYHETADRERRSSRSEIPITLYDPSFNLMASPLFFSGVRGSYDMITEAFRKEMISTPNSP